jgi:hypothetical protein
MGYTKSPRSITKVRPILELLLNSNAPTIELPTQDATKLIYNIREAINAAKSLQSKDPSFEGYASLQEKYILRLRRDSIVAELRDSPALSIVDSIPTKLSQLTIPGVSDIFGVVGAAIKHKNHTRLHFPDASRDSVDMTKLQKWATGSGYEVTVQEPHGYITLIKKDAT